MSKQEHTYSVKNVKTYQSGGDEGAAWTASLYRDGKRIGTAGYDGWGGEVWTRDVPDDALEDMRVLGALDYAAWCADNGTTFDGNTNGLEDIFIENLVNAAIRAQDEKREVARMRRQAKRDTLFVLEGEDENDSYRFFRGVPYGVRVLFHCRKKYGEGVRVYVPALDAWQPISEAIAPYEGQESQTA